MAIAAKQLLASGVKRILIVDWDVHHGNSTRQVRFLDKGSQYINCIKIDGNRFNIMGLQVLTIGMDTV